MCAAPSSIPSRPIGGSSIWESVKQLPSDVKDRIICNPLMHIGVETTATIGFSAAVLTGYYSIPTILFAKCLGAIGATLLGQMYIFRRELLFRVTLLFRMFKHTLNPEKYSWFDKINFLSTDATVLLGGIPLKHHQTIERTKPQAVLSMLEKHEQNAKGIFFTSYTAEDYQKAGIDFKQVSVPDYSGVPVEAIKQGVDFLDEKISEGKSVYVHCKAGRGRSVTVFVCYFIKKNFQGQHVISIKESIIKSVIQIVKSNRVQVNLNKEQRESIGAYFDFLHPPSGN